MITKKTHTLHITHLHTSHQHLHTYVILYIIETIHYSTQSLIFLVSNGKITSYNSEGLPNWELSTPIQWHDSKEGKRSKGAGKAWRFPKLEGKETQSFPSLTGYPLEVASPDVRFSNHPKYNDHPFDY
jgi:hypothetical protein